MDSQKLQIRRAVHVLKSGGIVIYPTDTAFGIGCRVDDEKALRRLFRIRKRPLTQATSVLVDTVKMARDYAEDIPQEVIDKLIEPYWPGALTIVLQSKIDKVPLLVRGGSSTIGVRMPNHPVPRSLIRQLGLPILGPSANFHGEPTSYRFEDLNPELVKLVDYALSGTCSICQPSTVIDCTQTPWKILRKGAVKISNFKYQISNINSKKDVILYVDTSSSKQIEVAIEINGKKDVLKEVIGEQKAQVVLPMIESLLKKNSLSIRDLNEIRVNTGPGSFTGLRVGIAVANALAFALRIPINGQRVGEFVEPVYT